MREEQEGSSKQDAGSSLGHGQEWRPLGTDQEEENEV